MIADTSFVVALMNATDADHHTVRAFFGRRPQPLETTPLALAEIDHLVTRQGGAAAAASLRTQLESGGLRVEWWPDALRSLVEVAARHASMGIGLADASLVALAGHVGTASIATLDERHFRHLTPLTGEAAFTLLPTDAPAD
ncbi:MAG TPA: PIN domain-containing protein [Solirubrobacteraceae bacterium]